MAGQTHGSPDRRPLELGIRLPAHGPAWPYSYGLVSSFSIATGTTVNRSAVTRKLAAILIADVVGFSRHMEPDEAGAFARLRVIRERIIDPKIAEHGGRIVKTAGDGMLLEFGSADAALRCAIDVQRAMRADNQSKSSDERIEFRIGINLGDIIVDGDDIAGDGVNITVTARIDGGTGRDLRVERGARASAREPQRGLRRHRRAAGQEHHAADPGVSRGARRQRSAKDPSFGADAKKAITPLAAVGG
jgi:class 3 adenylate cyclase